MRNDAAIVSDPSRSLDEWRLAAMSGPQLALAAYMLLVKPPRPEIPWWRPREREKAKREYGRLERARWQRWSLVVAALAQEELGT